MDKRKVSKGNPILEMISEKSGVSVKELERKFDESEKFGGGDYEGNWPLVKNPDFISKKKTPEVAEYIRKRQHAE